MNSIILKVLKVSDGESPKVVHPHNTGNIRMILYFRTKIPLIRASQILLSFTFIKHIDRRKIMEK